MFVIPLSYSLTSSSSVPIAPAVVTKSAASSVDSICSIYGLFILLYRKVSVDSVDYSPTLIKLKQSV